MPIDLASIAASFVAPFALQLRGISLAFEEVGRRLRERLREASLLESASREYPTLRFQDDAVTLWIDRLQHHSLTPPPPSRDLGDSLQRAGSRFRRELGRVPEALREEQLLPGLLARGVRVLAIIDASIARFERPTPGMFEGKARTASDLFGEGVLALRAVHASTGQLGFLAWRMGHAKQLFADYSARQALKLEADTARAGGAMATAAAALPTGPLPVAESPADLLDRGARYLLGVVLILPVLPEWLSLLYGAGGINLRAFVIDTLMAVERSIFDLRARVLDVFYVDLMGLVRQASTFIWSVQLVFMEALRAFLDFGLLYGEELVAGFSFFLDDLGKCLRWWTEVLERGRRLIEDIMDLDLRPIISMFLGAHLGVLLRLPGMPSITLRDLAAAAGEAGRLATKGAFLAWIASGEAVLSVAPEFLVPDKEERLKDLALAKQLVLAVTSATPAPPGETRGFKYPGVPFVDLGQAFFGPGAPDFKATVRQLGEGLRTTVRGTLGAGTQLLEGLSGAFEQVSTEAALLGSPARYRAITERSERLSETVFGSQTEALRKAIAARPKDPLAEAFIGWMSTGGFHLIGDTVPLYVEQMDTFWREQRARNEELTVVITETSPHILARRAELARVRMQRLTLDARGRPLDESLAQDIANQFRSAVTGAYTTGLERLRRAGHGA